MKNKSPRHLGHSNSLLILFFLAAASASSLVEIAMASEPEQAPPAAAQEAAVHIVYVDRPEDADPEEFHIRTLAPVLGSEDKAKNAVLYHYKHAASGFSAKLTPGQVEGAQEATRCSSGCAKPDLPAPWTWGWHLGWTCRHNPHHGPYAKA